MISVMEKSNSLRRLKQQIDETRRQLLELGPIHPGSISSQYHACGNPSCRCHDPDRPAKHGPYSKLTYVHAGRPACRFVRPECVGELRERLANYKTFRKLTAKWVQLAIQAGMAEFFTKTEPGHAKPPRREP
jgi:hypothetical protein